MNKRTAYRTPESVAQRRGGWTKQPWESDPTCSQWKIIGLARDGSIHTKLVVAKSTDRIGAATQLRRARAMVARSVMGGSR